MDVIAVTFLGVPVRSQMRVAWVTGHAALVGKSSGQVSSMAEFAFRLVIVDFGTHEVLPMSLPGVPCRSGKPCGRVLQIGRMAIHAGLEAGRGGVESLSMTGFAQADVGQSGRSMGQSILPVRTVRVRTMTGVAPDSLGNSIFWDEVDPMAACGCAGGAATNLDKDSMPLWLPQRVDPSCQVGVGRVTAEAGSFTVSSSLEIGSVAEQAFLLGMTQAVAAVPLVSAPIGRGYFLVWIGRMA